MSQEQSLAVTRNSVNCKAEIVLAQGLNGGFD